MVLFAVDVAARILGGIGTGASLVAAAVAFLTYRRDRPKLVLGWRLTLTEGRPTWTLDVTNDGRQATSISGAAVQNARVSRKLPWRLWVARPLRLRPLGRCYPIEPTTEPIFLEPGRHLSFDFDAEHLHELARRSDRLYTLAFTLGGPAVVQAFPAESVGILRGLGPSVRDEAAASRGVESATSDDGDE